jgi:hypothetical protein
MITKWKRARGEKGRQRKSEKEQKYEGTLGKSGRAGKNKGRKEHRMRVEGGSSSAENVV